MSRISVLGLATVFAAGMAVNAIAQDASCNPAAIVFKTPISKPQLPSGTLPEIIIPGVDFIAAVEVQDSFGNPVDCPVTVSITSLQPNSADVGAPGDMSIKSVTTDPATGLATFTVRVTNGEEGQIIDMVAMAFLEDGSTVSDVGSLHISFGDYDPECTLRYTASIGGMLQGVSTQVIYPGERGTSVEAIPYTGYHFVGWSDGVTTESRTDDYTDTDISVTAQFAINTYTFSYSTGEYGQIVTASDFVNLGTSHTVQINHGTSGPDIIAIPNPGYTFYMWSDSVTTAQRQDKNAREDILLMAYFIDEDGNISIKDTDRFIPENDNSHVVIVPVFPIITTFSAGPNPVNRRFGIVNLFRQGKPIRNGTLKIYDLYGNYVNKIKVTDNLNRNRRSVGSWDFKDRKGRTVSEGTYLVKGTITGIDGTKECVSLIVGVR